MPVNLAAGAGSDTLVLRLTQDAHRGAALYTVRVDGKQIGGTFAANAPHDSGQQDTLTLRGDWAAGSHQVSVNFLNDLWEPGAGDRNLYLESATYNAAAVPGAKASLLSSGATAFAFTEAAPVRPAPVSLSGGSGPDSLVLKVSQDAYQGSAQYTVSVDGKQVGGTFTASALKSLGQSDTLTLKGDWAAGVHKVEVKFLNDAWGGTDATDRNLYVDSATYNGAAVSGATKALKGAGPQSFAFAEAAPAATFPPASPTAGSGPDSLVLKISQDAHQGSAQYTVSVDGKQVGGTFTASALKSAGQADTLTLKGDWAAGTHSVQVNFVNDLYTPGAGDRNLYVDSATYNGKAAAGADLDLLSSGAQGFSFTDGAAPSPTPTKPTTPPTGSSGNFFSPDSPWNVPLAAGRSYSEVPGLDTLASRGAVGLATWSDENASTAIFHAKDSDPLVLIRHMNDSWTPFNEQGVKRYGNSAAVENQYLLNQDDQINQFPQNFYSTQKANQPWNGAGAVPKSQYDEWVQTEPLYARIPANAVPAPDGDGLTAIIQPDGRVLQMYSPYKLSDGTWISQMFTMADNVNGKGDGATNGQRASLLPTHGGTITEADIASGVIDHALAMNVPAAHLQAAFTYPALAVDSNTNYSGTIPMGARLAIPKNIDVDAMGLDTAVGRMIAHAAQDYGIIAVDRGGGGFTVSAQYDPEHDGPLQYSDAQAADLQDIFRAAQMVQPDSMTLV